MFHFSRKSILVNEEQRAAICRSPTVHQRILASAGSGKTTTLTARIAWLIEEHKVNPSSIVLMTFSRNAARQMKQKIESLIGETKLWAGTFHSLSRALLSQYNSKKLKTLYFVDELVSMGEDWLKTQEGRAWVGTLQYIFVDEFQDINEPQWKMLQRMLHPRARLIVVGDDCQNIYTWRGSHVKYLLELHKDMKDVVDDNLRRNYRSRESIVRCANAVTRRIPTLETKGAMISEKKGGVKPSVHFFYRACDETRWILQTIQDVLKKGKQTIAILSRTNGDLYRIEEEMIKAGLQCRLRDIVDEGETHSARAVIDLVTLHASKGLEWDVVFMVNCNDDVFPSSKKAEALICERRLFYVGVTRAREILHFSYTKDERSLSRFIREIPTHMLLYHGLAKYSLSEMEIKEGKKYLTDIIASLDGDALQQLRMDGSLAWLSRESLRSETIFRNGEVWTLPPWATGEQAADFQRFLRIWVLRYIASLVGTPFRELTVERMLFTLRVYSEDKEFWMSWSQEIMDCLLEFFGDEEAKKAPPSVDYDMMDRWAKSRSLPWTSQDLVRATSLVAKIRGQLRPIRFDRYDLREFRLAHTRYVVPTEWRADVLRSWRQVTDTRVGWKECLVDIWKLGAMALVAKGRNAALYRATSMEEKLSAESLHEYLECLELRLHEWFMEKGIYGICQLFAYEKEDLVETVDIHIENMMTNIGTQDSQDLLMLAMTAWFADDSTENIAIFSPIEGRFSILKLPEDWPQKAEHILETALTSFSS
jgi:hypothetical protein